MENIESILNYLTSQLNKLHLWLMLICLTHLTRQLYESLVKVAVDSNSSKPAWAHPAALADALGLSYIPTSVEAWQKKKRGRFHQHPRCR